MRRALVRGLSLAFMEVLSASVMVLDNAVATVWAPLLRRQLSGWGWDRLFLELKVLAAFL
jgi:hypothetical protein